MRAVSGHRRLDWLVVFFLQAMHAQATVNIQTAGRDLPPSRRDAGAIPEVLNSQFHDQALDFVFAARSSATTASSNARIPPSSARALSRRLVEAGMLRTIEPASGRRAMYAFDPLLDLLKV